MSLCQSITETIGRTPLLELKGLEKELGLTAQIFAKLECFNPGGSIKDRAALSMIKTAQAEGKLLPRGHLKVDREVDLKKLMKTTQLGLSTVMVDRRQIGKTVPFPEKRTLSEDTAAWMSLMRRGFKSYGIPRVMMLYRVRSSQLSGNKARMAFNMLNNYLREKSIPLHKRFYYWSCYAVNGFAKRLRKSGGIPAEILQNFDQRYNR